MQTGNTLLLNPKENKKHYETSDKHFMPLEQSLMAHTQLPRVAWVREWVHELGSENHLDIGAKDGYTCLTLQAEGVNCTGIDPSEDAIEEARTKAETAKLDCTFIVGYGEDIPDTIRVDTLSIMEVLEHVVNPNKLLEVASRTAMYVMITTPDVNGRHGMKDAERNQEHVRLYSKKELERLCGKYGTIKESIIQDDQLHIIFKPK